LGKEEKISTVENIKFRENNVYSRLCQSTILNHKTIKSKIKDAMLSLVF